MTNLDATYNKLMDQAKALKGRAADPLGGHGSRSGIEKERIDAIQELKKDFPKGSTVFLILRHRAASGMSRTVGVVKIVSEHGKAKYGLHPNYKVALVIGMKVDREKDGIKIGGVGYDVGTYIVDALAKALHGDSQALRKEWL